MTTAIQAARLQAAKERRREMSHTISIPICSVCSYPYPHITHKHHVHPLASSDTINEETVWLCPNCHAMVHEIRRVHFSSGRTTRFKSRFSLLDNWVDVTDRVIVNKLFDLARRSK